jgi:hypothetical protein
MCTGVACACLSKVGIKSLQKSYNIGLGKLCLMIQFVLDAKKSHLSLKTCSLQNTITVPNLPTEQDRPALIPFPHFL